MFTVEEEFLVLLVTYHSNGWYLLVVILHKPAAQLPKRIGFFVFQPTSSSRTIHP
jgi:hypothetical protein